MYLFFNLKLNTLNLGLQVNENLVFWMNFCNLNFEFVFKNSIFFAKFSFFLHNFYFFREIFALTVRELFTLFFREIFSFIRKIFAFFREIIAFSISWKILHCFREKDWSEISRKKLNFSETIFLFAGSTNWTIL